MIAKGIVRRKKLEKFLTKLPGASSSYPFGPEALVFKVMDKMFALVAHKSDSNLRITLKADPEDVQMLAREYDSITFGYHMNKKHWITIDLQSNNKDEFLLELAKNS
jgi:predicted DNA-binding protein (MmcQ/YjbR family)